MKHISKFHFILFSLFTVTFIFNSISCHENNSTEPKSIVENLANYKIALYLDNGVFDICRTNMVSMLNEMNSNYNIITRDSILSGCLLRYDLLLMPGGDMWTYRDYLGSRGMDSIKKYINRGGGYLGICGGASFAAYKVVWRGWAGEPRINVSMYGLNLFNGTADGPIEDFAPTYDVEKCKIKLIDKNHPVCTDIQDTIAPGYKHGPKFLFDSSQVISVIGKTVTGEKAAIIAFKYNSGKVFLINSHPEFDVERSSWGIIKNAIKWCSRR